MRSAASRRARASVCASEHPSRPFAFGKGGLRVRTVEKYAGRRGLSLGVTFLALRAAFLSDSPLGGRRRRAWTCEDASPQGLATRIEPSPASEEPSRTCPPRFRPRSRPFGEPKSS